MSPVRRATAARPGPPAQNTRLALGFQLNATPLTEPETSTSHAPRIANVPPSAAILPGSIAGVLPSPPAA